MKVSTINKKLNSKKIESLFFVIGILIIIIAWWLSSANIDNEIIIPKIDDVVKRVFELISSALTIKIILLTMLKLIIIVLACSVIAYLLAIVSYISNAFRMILKPIMTLIRTLPIASVIILLLIYVGLKATPLYICAFVVLPVIYEQVLVSFDGIEKNIIEETKMLSNLNFYIVFKVYFPMTFSYFVTSIFTVLGLGLKVLVMAEMFSLGNNTIGQQFYDARSLSDTTTIFAWTVILLIIVFVFETIIRLIVKKRAV